MGTAKPVGQHVSMEKCLFQPLWFCPSMSLARERIRPGLLCHKLMEHSLTNWDTMSTVDILFQGVETFVELWSVTKMRLPDKRVFGVRTKYEFVIIPQISPYGTILNIFTI